MLFMFKLILQYQPRSYANLSTYKNNPTDVFFQYECIYAAESFTLVKFLSAELQEIIPAIPC